MGYKINNRTITESYNSLYSLVSRFISQIPTDIGCRGDVGNEIVNLCDVFGADSMDIVNIYNRNYDEDESFFEEVETVLPGLAKLYRGYAKAMSRRRPDSVLEPFRFFYYALSEKTDAFMYGDSALLGKFANGYFKVSHFCPSNLKEGLEMLKRIAEYDNIIFTVTSDLAPMLLKIGLYGDENASANMVFRSFLTHKYLLTTDKDLLERILSGRYANELVAALSDGNTADVRDIVRGRNKYSHLQDRTYAQKERLPMRFRSRRDKGLRY